MPFVNELIPEEAKKTFDFTIFKSSSGRPVNVSSPFKTWTIDKERNAFLICTETGSGPDGPGWSSFNLWWNGENVNVAGLQEYYNDEQRRLVINWNRVVVYLHPEHEARRSEWIEAVREALLVYGFAGGGVNEIVTVNFYKEIVP